MKDLTKIKSFDKFSDLLKYKKLYEFSINKINLNKSKRFNETEDFVHQLNIINEIIKNIQKDIESLYFDDIIYDVIKYDNCYQIEIKYNENIKKDLLKIEEIIKNDTYLMNKILKNDYVNLFLEIEIHIDNSNKIDIVNELPIFMKGLGLGKKIYKKLIKDFSFICSYSGYEHSIESSMVWNKLIEDKNIYSFINGDNIIMFYDDVNYNTIIDELKKFLGDDKNKEGLIVDDDFTKKYGKIEF